MIYCKISAGLVVDRAVFDAAIPEDWPGRADWVPHDLAQIGWGYVGGEFIEPEAPAMPEQITPLSLQQVAAARLHIEGWDISGIERSQGIGAAMMIDENTAWILFADAQPDTNYIVTPGDGVTKTVDYIEILCPGVVDLALIVQRVQ